VAPLKLDYTRYYRYHAMVEALENFCLEFPQLTNLYSLGRSTEGREIWCIELTNKETGVADCKPGFYLDGNTHAGEVTGSMACLYTIDYVLNNYGKDDKVTWLMDNKAMYVIPRVSPDGAEFYLTTPYTVRSSNKEYTFPHYADPEGLVPEDLNGDGHILQMRVRDDVTGNMKKSETDPRVMVQRAPDDFGGEYYHIYTEGYIKGYDGYEIKMAPNRWGLDFNRNYPINWRPPNVQPGAGPRPISEPETAAIIDFLIRQKNLNACLYYHTSGGEHLRGLCVDTDDKMNPADLEMYKALGQRGTDHTGYPVKSLFVDYTNKVPQWGTFLDTTFTYLGMFSYATELWDMPGRAGIKDASWKRPWRMNAKEQEEYQLTLMKWNDEQMDGEVFVDWMEFDHPQLGKVELGGWLPKFGRQNPPAKLLQDEIHKNMLFSLAFAASLPGLAVNTLKAEKVAEDVYKVSAKVENTGYLPTSGSIQAANNKIASPVKVCICGGEIVQGECEVDIGHLKGHGNSAGGYMNISGGGSAKKVEWIIKAPAGSCITISAQADRAGQAQASITLP
jgi:murein tripeptide amidase MpaA